MTDAHSLRLSETDYDAIASAVMETARGRWFMAEYARRNRQADTQQLLQALGRIERVVGLAASAEPSAAVIDTAQLVASLRADLDRIGARSDHASDGIASRIEAAAGEIAMAVEDVQDLAWTMREAGVDEALCDRLDGRAMDIFTASSVIDGSARQIATILDTVAMIDSSLRALAGGDTRPHSVELDIVLDQPVPPAPRWPEPVGFEATADYVPAPVKQLPPEPQSARWSSAAEDDLFFADASESLPAPDRQRSEDGLRAIDAMSTDEKLAYFA